VVGGGLVVVGAGRVVEVVPIDGVVVVVGRSI